MPERLGFAPNGQEFESGQEIEEDDEVRYRKILEPLRQRKLMTDKQIDKFVENAMNVVGGTIKLYKIQNQKLEEDLHERLEQCLENYKQEMLDPIHPDQSTLEHRMLQELNIQMRNAAAESSVTANLGLNDKKPTKLDPRKLHEFYKSIGMDQDSL